MSELSPYNKGKSDAERRATVTDDDNGRLLNWPGDGLDYLRGVIDGITQDVTDSEIQKLRGVVIEQNKNHQALMLENRDLRSALHRLLNSTATGNQQNNFAPYPPSYAKPYGYPIKLKVHFQPGKVTLRAIDSDPPQTYDLPIEFFDAGEAYALENELAKAIRAAFPEAFAER